MEISNPESEITNSFSFQFQETGSTENHLWSIECERLWERIKSVQQSLENVSSQSVSVSDVRDRGVDADARVSTDNPQLQSPSDQYHQTLQEYEKRLRAELAFMKDVGHNEISSSHKEVEYLKLQQNLTRQNQHLKESLSYVRAKHSALSASIEEEEITNKMLKQVQDSLTTKITALDQPHSDQGKESADTVCADLKAKVNKLKQLNKQFQNGLRDVLSEFPSPSSTPKDQHRKKTKSALDNTRDYSDDDFMNLSSIIGRLMEQTLNSPEQPYIDISADMWPQHIEFLLRSQIVLKDPDNSSRMKLVPFHL